MGHGWVPNHNSTRSLGRFPQRFCRDGGVGAMSCVGSPPEWDGPLDDREQPNLIPVLQTLRLQQLTRRSGRQIPGLLDSQSLKEAWARVGRLASSLSLSSCIIALQLQVRASVVFGSTACQWRSTRLASEKAPLNRGSTRATPEVYNDSKTRVRQDLFSNFLLGRR